MLEFIVLGKIPGTQVQVDFMVLLIGASILVTLVLIYLFVTYEWREWRKTINAVRHFLYLQKTSL